MAEATLPAADGARRLSKGEMLKGISPSLCWGLSDAQISLVSGSQLLSQGHSRKSSDLLPMGWALAPLLKALGKHICWAGGQAPLPPGGDSCL